MPRVGRTSDAVAKSQGVLAGIELVPSGDDLREFEADLTPPGLAMQQCLELRRLGLEPRHVLDFTAGSGVVARCAQVVWPEANVVVGELRKEERPYLEQHFEHVWTGSTTTEDFRCWAQLVTRGQGYDLVVTNPAFSLWRTYAMLGLELIRKGGNVCLLGLDAWGQRSEDDEGFFRRFPPIAQHRITGPVSFRDDGKSDLRDYSWWTFSDGSFSAEGQNPTWTCANLPRLPGHLRRWRGLRPGREDACVYATLARELA